jgi:hypothetical protein
MAVRSLFFPFPFPFGEDEEADTANHPNRVLWLYKLPYFAEVVTRDDDCLACLFFKNEL